MKTEKWKTAAKLFGVFFKIGAFTFGGGYAMIPLIQKEVVQTHGWATDDDILEVVAIAEATPGPIAVNTATFIGWRACGFWGAAAATLGVVLPSFVIILAVSGLLRQFQQVRAVQYAFAGVRAGVLALILKALYSMGKKCAQNVFSYLMAGAVFLLAVFTPVSVIWLIAASAAVGIVYSAVRGRRAKP